MPASNQSPRNPGTGSERMRTSGTGSRPPPTAASSSLTPHPEPLAALAGTRRVLETAHKLIGNSWGDEGTTREQRAWTADPDLIRRLQVGQACYIHHGAATFVQVARPAASPLTLLPPPAPELTTAPVPEPRKEPGPPSWPGLDGLDDIFGSGDPR
jgi:hypothetical protein